MENRYGFNAYDTVIALVLTQYLKGTGNPKTELAKVVGRGEVDGAALARLLDSAATWAQEGLHEESDPLNDKLTAEIKGALKGFSGTQYVQAMDAGFVEFLNDFYHNRIRR